MREEIVRAVQASAGTSVSINGELHAETLLGTVIGFMYAPRQGLLAELKQTVYFSDCGPAGGGNFALTAAQLGEIGGPLESKWQADHSYPKCSKCILLVYRHEGRPDREWLKETVAALNRKHGVKFAEVWFLKPYPDGRDDIWTVFDAAGGSS